MNTENNIQREEDLICEALVREIGGASRWSARVEAWEALLSTRREGGEPAARTGAFERRRIFIPERRASAGRNPLRKD
jgi:hypothetical protein